MKKKMILIFVAVTAFTAVISAQPRSLGVRVTDGVDISYQHTVGARENFFEVDLGYIAGSSTSFECFNAVAIYDFMIAQPDWTSRGEWGFYAGPGIAIGAGSSFAIGIAGNVGLEYTFWFPLQLSFDVRPQIGYVSNSNNPVWGWYPALGVRYRF